jgi:hypothetical protein
MIIYSICSALSYLEEKGIIYGVLGCDKMFVDQQIKIIDPSATAMDPLMITEGRLYSPEIIAQEDEIDMFKSDVYVFALCIMEVVLLTDFSETDN